MTAAEGGTSNGQGDVFTRIILPHFIPDRVCNLFLVLWVSVARLMGPVVGIFTSLMGPPFAGPDTKNGRAIGLWRMASASNATGPTLQGALAEYTSSSILSRFHQSGGVRAAKSATAAQNSVTIFSLSTCASNSSSSTADASSDRLPRASTAR